MYSTYTKKTERGVMVVCKQLLMDKICELEVEFNVLSK